MSPRLLDLFCGAGGASEGYARAGFEVVGVDISPQPRYPFRFIQADALAHTQSWLDALRVIDQVPAWDFDAIHASPPCQALTTASNRWRGSGGVADSHLNLIPETRSLLDETGLPYVIENVPGARAHMRGAITLHGGMFNLGVQRPRLFESNVLLLAPKADAARETVGVYGERPDGRRLNFATSQRAASSLEQGREAMGIDWMEWRELCEAIPPAYTEYLGHQLLAYVAKT